MLLTALALSAAQAPEQVDPATFDLRCLVAIGAMMNEVPEDQRANFTAASLFFFGRVDVHFSEAEIEARAPREAAAIEAGDRAALVRACGDFMSERGRVLIDIGTRTGRQEVPARR